MRYRLRTLLIIMAVLPPMLAALWIGGRALVAEYFDARNSEWEDVGAPGVIDTSTWTFSGCELGEANAESESADAEPASEARD